MKAIIPIRPEAASEKAKASLDIVERKLGWIPAMYQVMANSPAVLDAYVKFNSALSAGTLGAKMSEAIAVSTAEFNRCSYCLSAHSHIGQRVGLSKQAIEAARGFRSDDPKMNEGLVFTKKLLENPGTLSPADLIPLRSAGYTDGEILELIGNVVRNIFTNYLNTISDTPVDWPEVIEPYNVQNKQ